MRSIADSELLVISGGEVGPCTPPTPGIPPLPMPPSPGGDGSINTTGRPIPPPKTSEMAK